LTGPRRAESFPSMAARGSNFAAQARALLGWFRPEGRNMPWRRTRDPWAIWVSEIMLQQTRVSAVRERFQEFLRRFPRPSDLARAGDDELLSAWKGLGYYRRARLLREGARVVTERHGGEVPSDPEAFGALPGIGPYTMGAVLSIAFGLPFPALDGNVERVASRFLLLEADPKKKEGRNRIARWIASLHRVGEPGVLNQALMDLGALVCLPKAPSCGECPLKAWCRAFREGRQKEFPRRPERTPPREVTTQVGLAFRSGLVLARRIPEKEINQGQLGLPGLGIPLPAGKDLAVHLHKTCGLRVSPGPRLCTVRHTITRYRILVEAFLLQPPPPLSRPGKGLEYQDPRDPDLPWTTVARKIFRVLEESREGLFPWE